MPWVKTEDCVGCKICVEACPVDAISMTRGAAVIDEKSCIRCGKCHDVCPQQAVRHDSERIPQEIEENLDWTRELLRHFETTEDQQGLVERMKRYFNKERKVADQTIERLEDMQNSL